MRISKSIPNLLQIQMSPKKFETNAIRQQLSRTPYGEHSSPLFLTSSFIFENAERMRASFAEENDQKLYSRFSNPNTTEFIDKVVTMAREMGITRGTHQRS